MGSKCSNKIRCIVRLRQMLRRWRARAAASSGQMSDVPAGHVAVSVNSHRFIVRTAYLNHPAFRQLLHLAEEEYGFNNVGPLELPCDESLFRVVLRHVSSSKRGVSLDELRNGVCGCGCCTGKIGPAGRWQPDNLPLLRGFDDRKCGVCLWDRPFSGGGERSDYSWKPMWSCSSGISPWASAGTI